MVDDWLAGLLGDEPGVALLAVGAYGRRELCPASDLDLVLVHDGRARPRPRRRSPTAVWYPIWDAGFKLDHSVRTPKEARAVADRRPEGRARPARRARRGGRRGAGRAAARPHRATTGATGRRKRLPGFGDLVERRHRVVRRRRLRARARSQGGTGRQPRRRRPARPGRASPTCTRPTSGWPARSARCSTRASRCSAWPAGPTGSCSSTRTTVADALGLGDADELMAPVSAAARTIALAIGRRVARGAVVAAGTRGRSAAGPRPRRCRPAAGAPRRRGRAARRRVARRRPRARAPGAPPTPAYLGAPIARPTLRRFDAELGRRARARGATDTRDAFVALLGGGDAMVPLVELLDEHGLLRAATSPSGTRVRCRPQRNAFHRFTVDRHLLEAVARAADLVRSGAPARPAARGRAAARPRQGRSRRPHRQRRGARRARSRPAWASTPPTSPCSSTSCATTCCSRATPPAATSTTRPPIDAVADAVGTEDTPRPPGRAAPRPTRSPPVPTAWSDVEGRAWSERLVDRCAASSCAAAPEQCGGRRARPARSAPRHVRRDAHRRSRAPGGVTLVAPDALGLLAVEVAVLGVHAQSVRRARTFTVDGVAVGEFELEPERGREPDWDRFAADLRAALVDPAPIRERLAARSRALRHVLPADRRAPGRATRVRRQRGHRRRHARRGAGRRRHRRPGPDHRRVRRRTACGWTRRTCRPSATRWSTPST